MLKLAPAKEKILNNIEIILVSPQIPDNIGLVARVLKNTSFFNLSLVEPNLTKKAFLVAKRAIDILNKAKVFKSLKEAISNSNFVFGTTRRKREYKFIFNFEEVKHFIIAMATRNKISIVFGKEDFGLSNKDIELCDSIFYIPANPKFSSYNLAFSVGIFCYEIFRSLEVIYSLTNLELAKKKEIESLFFYLKEYLRKKLDKKKLESVLTSLKRLFLRTHLTKNEVALLKSLVLKVFK
ncbi:MAG: TrmJ/YjtD family RNA methyltransferase [Candidatus Aenigmatarchaeota archaeon]